MDCVLCRIRCIRPAVLAAAALSVCATVVRGQCPPGSLFSPPAGYATGSFPRFLAAGDFNGDAVLDLAVANSAAGTNTVSVLLGNGSPGAGDGTFRPGGVFDAGGPAQGLAVGEFTGDSFRDLVVANGSSATITVLPGAGDGTFSAPKNHAVGSNPENLAVGDFNGDGVHDLAIADRDTRGIYVLLGQGTGDFVAGFTSILVYSPFGIIATDLSGDGILDLVFIASFGRLGVMLGAGAGGLGNGTFATPSYYPGGLSPSDLAVLDFNQDGRQDVVVANRVRGGINAFAGIGGGALVSSGGFAPGLTLTTVAATHVDGDAIPDLLATTSPENQLLFLKGTGAGAGIFGPPTVEAVLAPGPSDLLLGDFNADCATDVAAVSTNGTPDPPTSLSILLAGCVPPACSSEPSTFAAADRPGDQGGAVRLSWHRSVLDAAGAVSAYQVWRQVLVPATGQARPAPVGARSEFISGADIAPPRVVADWVHILDVPAIGALSYVADVPTTRDSVSGDSAPHAFFVRAVTNGGGAYYDSEILTTHSVDNLAPPAPPYVLAQLAPTSTIWLHWGPSVAPDLLEYRVHRGGTPLFVPGPGNLIATVADTQYVDPVGSPTSSYKVMGVDIHGNVGPAGGGATILCGPPACSFLARYPVVTRSLEASAYDTTFSNVYGERFRAAYNLSQGWHIASASGEPGIYTEVVTSDVYWIEGAPLDQPFTFNAWLQVGSQTTQHCGIHCASGYVEATIAEVGAPSSPCPESSKPCVRVTRRGYEPFRLSVRALAGAGGFVWSSSAIVNATLRISGLPPGAYLTSCSGYFSDKSVPAQLSLVHSRVESGVARVTWHTPDRSVAVASVYRRSQDDDWSHQGEIVADGSGLLVHEDRTVIGGRRYGYRLGVMDGGDERLLGEAWVEVPGLARLALEEPSPNPAAGPIRARFSLAAMRPAWLELFDVSGRRLHSREVGGLGSGSHTLVLEESGTLRPGIYLLRLSQDSARITKRVVKIR